MKPIRRSWNSWGADESIATILYREDIIQKALLDNGEKPVYSIRLFFRLTFVD